MILTGFIPFIVGIIIIALVVWLLSKSIRIIFKFILNSIIGFFFLLIFNFFGAIVGLHLSMNVLNSFVVGVFGLPGIIVLLALKYIFGILL